jgi:hypothetical protein
LDGSLISSPHAFPVGTNIVTCTATNAAGTNTCVFTVIVRDIEPPVIASLSATPNVLRPPNHRMAPVSLNVSATDNCGVASCKIIDVTSNEPDNGLGDGDTARDFEITGDLSVKLRAERSGKGHGRIYTITVECKDSAGNATAREVHVMVPR